MKDIKLVDFNSEVAESKEKLQSVFNRVLDSGWFILGQEVKKFETEFADYLGVKHCIGVANGLEALQISLTVLDIGQGDEVITTPVSAIATTLAILAIGAKPVFVDIDENGLIDLNLVEKAVTKRTKAVLPVHLYGNPVDLEKLKSICQRNNLLLIEDACQAHGSEFQGKKLGTYGELGCFSFYPTKNLGAFGDGGAIVTNSSKLAKRCFQIRDYGQSKKYLHQVYGLNSRLDELQAAFLRVKLRNLSKNNRIRQRLAKRYLNKLADRPEIEFVMPLLNSEPNYHQFVIKTKKRDQLKIFLQKNGILTDIHYPLTIPDQPLLKKDYKDVDIPMAKRFVKEILSLPVNPYLTDDQICYISDKIRSFFK